MTKKPKSENVQVILRLRPMNRKEKEAGFKEAVTADIGSNSVTVVGAGVDERAWAFDAVYTNSFTQKDVYLQSIHPVVETVLQGYNGTIFAYGQSGTGKSFSMCGNLDTPELYGIIPNTLQHIFQYISEQKSDKLEFYVAASYLELYNGKCRDLLVDGKTNLELKENAQKLFYVKDLSSMEVTSTKHAMELMEEGLTRREVKATDLNADSSRSHSVFTITIRTHDREQDVRTESKLNLVDLAGSERVSKTNATGDTAKEGTNINLSLTALGTVIDCLVKAKPHIPYRSSPLTMILKDGLGGNSRTVIVGTIGPADFNCSETVSTLRFIDRAKQIKNKPKVQMDPKDAKIAELMEEIQKLRRQLGLADDDTGEGEDGEEGTGGGGGVGGGGGDGGDGDGGAGKKPRVTLYDDELQALRRRVEELEVQVDVSHQSSENAAQLANEFAAKEKAMSATFAQRAEEYESRVSELSDRYDLEKIAAEDAAKQLAELMTVSVGFLTTIDKDNVWTTTVNLTGSPMRVRVAGSKKEKEVGGPTVEDILRGFKMFIGNGVDMKLHALPRRASMAHIPSGSMAPHPPQASGTARVAGAASPSAAVSSPRNAAPAVSVASAEPTAASGESPSATRASAPRRRSRDVSAVTTPVDKQPESGEDDGEDDDPFGMPVVKKDKEKKKKKDKKEKKEKKKKSKELRQAECDLPSAVIEAALEEASLNTVAARNVVDALLAQQRVLTMEHHRKRLSAAVDDGGDGGGAAENTQELMTAVNELTEQMTAATDAIAKQKEQLAKTKAVAEKKLAEVAQLKEHIDSLREELASKHTQHASELAMMQDRLVQQHNKKTEALVNKHAKAIVKERKLRDAVQAKLEQAAEERERLEQAYDVKVMELDAQQRDFEQLKIDSLRAYKDKMSAGYVPMPIEPREALSPASYAHMSMMAQLRSETAAPESNTDRLRLVVEKARNGNRMESRVPGPRSAPEVTMSEVRPASNNAGNPFSRNPLDGRR